MSTGRTHRRTYDADGFKMRSACLCLKPDTDDEILLVSSNMQPGKWTVPGGGIDPGEGPEVAAVREVLEEAGAKGRLGALLGVIDDVRWKKRTFLYVFRVSSLLEEWLERTQGRVRRWFAMEEARESIKPDLIDHLDYLDQLPGPTSGQRLTLSVLDTIL